MKGYFGILSEKIVHLQPRKPLEPVSVNFTSNGKERQSHSGHPRVHRAQDQRTTRHFPLHHDEEQEEHARPFGDEKVQPHPQEDDGSQGNQVIQPRKRIGHGKESSCYPEDRQGQGILQSHQDGGRRSLLHRGDATEPCGHRASEVSP